MDREQPIIWQAERLEGQPQEIRSLGLEAHFDHDPERSAIDQADKCRARLARQTERAELAAQRAQVRLQRGELGGDRIAAQPGPGSAQEGGLRSQEGGRQRGVGGPTVHLPTKTRLDPQPNRAFAAQADQHPLRAARHRPLAGRRAGAAPVEPRGDCVDVIDPDAGERTQERRDPGVLAEDDRDQDLTLVDLRVGQIAELGPDPAVVSGVAAEDDQPSLGPLQAVVDADDNVVSWRNLPFVQPNLETTLAQPLREHFDGGFVFRRVADEDAHREAS